MSDLPDNETPDVTLDFTDGLIGREFKGAYRVADKIGEGGFGSVYRAVQMVVNREVAIKVLRPERARDERLRDLLTKRFKREAVAMSKLNHPNTVRLIDFGTSDDGMIFLVLELLRGRELEKVIRREAPLAPARAARIGQQICRSLGEAHQQGIIHRDLKPANIFLCEVEGDPDFVKVMDFGIARLVDPDEGAGQITRTGMTQGTPAYMAPEQAMAKETTAASDLYAVGCMLYEMLTGCPVFTAESAVAVGLAHVRQEPPRVTLPGLKPEVVEEWDNLLQRLLVKSPDERPQTTQEVVDALKKLEDLGGEIDRPDAGAATVAVPSTPLHQAVAEAEAADGATEVAQSSAELQQAVLAAEEADPDQATQMAPALSEDAVSMAPLSDQATQMAPAISDEATQMAPALSEELGTSDEATQMAPAISDQATQMAPAISDQATQMAPAITTPDEPTSLRPAVSDPGQSSSRGLVLAVIGLLVIAGLAFALGPKSEQDPSVAAESAPMEEAPAPAELDEKATRSAPAASPKAEVDDRTHLVLRSFPGQVLVHRGARVLCTTPCDMYVKPGTGEESLVFRKAGYMDLSLTLTLAPGRLERTVQLAPAAQDSAPAAAPLPVSAPESSRGGAAAPEPASPPKARKKRSRKALPGFRGSKGKKAKPKPPPKAPRKLPKLRMGNPK